MSSLIGFPQAKDNVCNKINYDWGQGLNQTFKNEDGTGPQKFQREFNLSALHSTCTKYQFIGDQGGGGRVSD